MRALPEAAPGDTSARGATARVVAALREAGAAGRVLELEASTRTAADAAAALGCRVAAIANSLIFVADGTAVLVLTSGAHRVDTSYLAAAMGWSELRRATPEEVRAATGQVVGGVAPLGHPEPLEALIDEDLASEQRIWAAAGSPHAVFETTFEELSRLAGARRVRVAGEGSATRGGAEA